ncbi:MULTISPECIES: acyl carrier protein [Streptomycetaceae]|uniref:acyl carrier protein n=1 Tax=Streptomycetaceae TaxID=2062 RepID=UPI00036813D2|nr:MULTISPECIES: acyl carrier protein [Streptomycetaceae]MDX2853048.1 acyl carrier protein [Streptomyces sp. PA03-3a]MYX34261.1 acyl carrier protein [Streptomyces sp. SID8377]
MSKELTYGELAALMKSSAGITVEAGLLVGHPETPFAEYGLDSLGLLGIVGALENDRGIPIAGDADSCKTPGAFMDVVNTSLKAGV